MTDNPPKKSAARMAAKRAASEPDPTAAENAAKRRARRVEEANLDNEELAAIRKERQSRWQSDSRGRQCTDKANLASLAAKTAKSEAWCDTFVAEVREKIRDDTHGFALVNGLCQVTTQMQRDPSEIIKPRTTRFQEKRKGDMVFDAIFDDKWAEATLSVSGRFINRGTLKQSSLSDIADMSKVEALMACLGNVRKGNWQILLSDTSNIPQRVHCDFPITNSKAWHSRLANKTKEIGPCSVICCVQDDAVVHFWGTDKGRQAPPSHPSSQPTLSIRMKCGQFVIFRHDMWHAGSGYKREHFRLFAAFEPRLKKVDIHLAKNTTHHAPCECTLVDSCECVARVPEKAEALQRVSFKTQSSNIATWSKST